MGVAGCGKSTFGQALAQSLSLSWIEGDDFHSAASKAKMAAGIPLDDGDRAGWLHMLAGQIKNHPKGCVIGCSALKTSYRDILRSGGELRFAYLKLTREESQKRVSNRAGHFFSDTLVASQFAALQEPSSEPDVITLDATLATQVLVARVLAQLTST
ncbi:MAG: gluconokinase [Burkholderiales bacterium]|nr:MAG: gluconokinase [Burkholderiales bacterium]